MHLYIIYTVLTADTLPAVNLYHRYNCCRIKILYKNRFERFIKLLAGHFNTDS